MACQRADPQYYNLFQILQINRLTAAAPHSQARSQNLRPREAQDRLRPSPTVNPKATGRSYTHVKQAAVPSKLVESAQTVRSVAEGLQGLEGGGEGEGGGGGC